MNETSIPARDYLSEIRWAKKGLEHEASEFLKDGLINFHGKTGFFPKDLYIDINVLNSASGKNASGASCKLEIESI